MYNVTCDFVIVFIVLVQDIALAKCQRATIQNKCTAFFFCSQVSKTTSNVLNCYNYKVNRCGVNKKVATRTMRPNVTISARAAVAPLQFSLSHWNPRNLTLHLGILHYKSLEIFSDCTIPSHGSIMLPPHQPRIFARLARWQ